MLMTTSLCLTRTEITELCRTPRKAGQLAFLRQNGIRHYLDAHGWPVITRAAVGLAPALEERQSIPKWRSNKAID